MDDWSGELEHVLRTVSSGDIVSRAAAYAGLDEPEAHRLLATYVGEARIGLDVVRAHMRPGMRVLEVGSGVGLLAAFLRSKGVDVVGIEPGLAGFGFMPALARAVRETHGPESLSALPLAAADLQPARHGVFELIYSVNVLEHIADLDGALAGFMRVLAGDGAMVHLCPNYVVPYEPHLGVPLVPLRPALTRHVLPFVRNARNVELWDGLTFVTAGRMERLARAHGLSIAFEPGLMARYARRLGTDPIFRARQPAALGALMGLLGRVGAIDLLARWPARWASPMLMVLKRSRAPARSAALSPVLDSHASPARLLEGGRQEAR